jgi:hypothetical protein
VATHPRIEVIDLFSQQVSPRLISTAHHASNGGRRYPISVTPAVEARTRTMAAGHRRTQVPSLWWPNDNTNRCYAKRVTSWTYGWVAYRDSHSYKPWPRRMATPRRRPSTGKKSRGPRSAIPSRETRCVVYSPWRSPQTQQDKFPSGGEASSAVAAHVLFYGEHHCDIGLGSRGHSHGFLYPGARRSRVAVTGDGLARWVWRWAEGKNSAQTEAALFLFILFSILLSPIFKFKTKFKFMFELWVLNSHLNNTLHIVIYLFINYSSSHYLILAIVNYFNTIFILFSYFPFYFQILPFFKLKLVS